ncbi:MAG: type II CAAX endopeptidase family protein, partial [Eubacteriales bacterium]|nr:type II CAAX endopeptidase family protein [Eubacteriales bacterium]
FNSQQEYDTYMYSRSLKKDANKAGAILLIYLGAMSIVVTIATFLSSVFDLGYQISDRYEMLLNGLASLVAFFGVAIIYSIIAKKDLGKIFPLEKVGTKLTFLLCSFGFAVAFTGNYVSELVLSLFDSTGVDAEFDMSYSYSSVIDIVLAYVTVALLPALVEEFAFRGLILGVLRKHSDALAILVSGITFSLMHGNFTQIPFTLVVGLVLGFITVKTNSLLPAMIIHFINNGFSVTLSILYANNIFDEYYINMIYLACIFIIALLGIISFTILCSKYKGFFKLSGSNNDLPFNEKVRTVCKSPTLIIFTVISLVSAIILIGGNIYVQ